MVPRGHESPQCLRHLARLLRFFPKVAGLQIAVRVTVEAHTRVGAAIAMSRSHASAAAGAALGGGESEGAASGGVGAGGRSAATAVGMGGGRSVGALASLEAAQVPRPDKWYLPVQCHQCKESPCTKVCPVQATWQEPDGIITVECSNDHRSMRALHGLTRALIANMITGVSKGFRRVLEIVGVGYKAELNGKRLNLVVGYSHPILITPPDGVQFIVENPTRFAGHC